jgi:hypothetical protein
VPTPTIPSGLQPVVSGYTIGPADGVVRTDVAGGMPRQGLAWDRGVQQFNVTLVLDLLEYSVWTAFYLHIIKKGALAFEMPLDSGFGLVTHQVSMLPGSYSAVRSTNRAMVVSFVVEAENSGYAMTGDDAQALVDLFNEYGAGSAELLERLATFANEDLGAFA